MSVICLFNDPYSKFKLPASGTNLTVKLESKVPAFNPVRNGINVI